MSVADFARVFQIKERQKQTWIKQMNKDLKLINKTLEELTVNDYEREKWKKKWQG